MASFYNRYPNDDEGMIAEWAYWLLHDGHAASKVMEPFGAGFHERITVYHKLTAWLALPSIYLFGMKLLPLKIIVFMFFVLLCFVAYKYTQTEPGQKKWFFIWFILLYALNARVFEFAFTFRPEIIMSALGFTGFFFIKRGIDHKKYTYIMWSGIFSGLAFLSHLNGISYLLSGFTLLLFLKQYRFAIWFGVWGGLMALFYFADMLDTNIYKSVMHDLMNSPDVKDDQFNLLLPFLKLVNEQQRFLHSPVEITLSALFVVSLIFRAVGW
jgi:hypothetical protein